jgi:aromatic-L-amino-acid decarboxylase
MLWQSSKYFGYFPSSIAVTNVIAEMFATTFHSPAFNFVASPSHTELENVTMDWAAIALGLPDKFLLKNTGGGIINNSTTESVFISIHAAKKKKMNELNI